MQSALTNTPLNCNNCGQEGSGNFCQNCGEAYHTHRITLKHMLHEVVHLFTHFDKGFLYTLKRLVLAPGHMQKDYIAGKRKGYQAPFSMVFVCGTITALGVFWINKAAGRLHGGETDLQENYFYQHYFALLQMALVPVYALINWLFYLKSKYNYAEFLVILLYNTSLILLVVLLSNSFKLVFGTFDTGIVEMLFVLGYNLVTYFNFFNTDSRWIIALKVIVTSVLCFAISRLAGELFMSVFIGNHH